MLSTQKQSKITFQPVRDGLSVRFDEEINHAKTFAMKKKLKTSYSSS